MQDIIITKNDNIEYLQFKKLLEFEDKGVGKTTDLHNKYLTELLKAIRKDLKLGYKSLPILCLKK